MRCSPIEQSQTCCSRFLKLFSSTNSRPKRKKYKTLEKILAHLFSLYIAHGARERA